MTPIQLTAATFHGVEVCPTHTERQFEKPWHRQAMFLLARGAADREVAALCEVHIESVRMLRRTGWFQTELTALIEKLAGKDLIDMFRADCYEARQIETELMVDDKTPSAVRANIAKTKIERVYGKATQRIEFDDVTQSSDPVAEVAELERGIALERDALGLPAPSGRS